MFDTNKYAYTIKNSKPLFDNFHCPYRPEIYYVFDRNSKKILLAFLDNMIFSHKSLMFIVEIFNGKVNYYILSKESYEEKYLRELDV